MKTLTLAAAAVATLLAACPLSAQDNTANTTRPDNAPNTARQETVGNAPRRTVRTVRTTRTTRIGSTAANAATISARDNARLNARLRAAEQAAISAQTPRVDGGLVRAARSDNPIQAVNPLAPAEYGTGEQVTRHEPDDPFQRPQGLRLVVVEF